MNDDDGEEDKDEDEKVKDNKEEDEKEIKEEHYDNIQIIKSLIFPESQDQADLNNDDEDEDEDNKDNKGIGGWLILFTQLTQLT